MYAITALQLVFYVTTLNVVFSICLSSKSNIESRCRLKTPKYTLFFVNYLKNLSQPTHSYNPPSYKINEDSNFLRTLLKLSEGDDKELDDCVERVLIGLENPQDIRGPYISSDGKIVNKKKKLYSTGELCQVDDFFEGKFRVEWTVRGVKEKLQYRYRDIHTLPLSTSRFSLAGINGFILRLWLDGHKGSKKGYIAMSLVQREHWSTLESPICLFAGKIVRGPFFYRSPEYFVAAKSLCRLEEVLDNNTIKLGVMIATRDECPKSA